MGMFQVKWISLVVNTVYLSWRGLSGGDEFLLQQKSSAAGFNSKLWNNDMGDDLSRALVSTVCILWSFSLCCCMTANLVTAELQHLHSTLNMLIKMNMAILNTEMEQNTTPGFATATRYGLKVSSKFECSHYMNSVAMIYVDHAVALKVLQHQCHLSFWII